MRVITEVKNTDLLDEIQNYFLQELNFEDADVKVVDEKRKVKLVIKNGLVKVVITRDEFYHDNIRITLGKSSSDFTLQPKMQKGYDSIIKEILALIDEIALLQNKVLKIYEIASKINLFEQIEK